MSQLAQSLFIVTGAASGIGRASAIRAAREGAHVLATDINVAALADTVATIHAAGGMADSYVLDVGDKMQIERFGQYVGETFANPRLILFNNAGVALGSGTFDDNTLEDFEWLLNINLWGVVRLTKALLPLLRNRGEGHIVNVSSVFGLFGAPENAAYCTAKFGVRGFTDTLRNELRGTGIQVSTVFPGGVSTNISAAARLGGGRTEEQRAVVAKLFAEKALTTPDKAAQIILDGIHRNKARILIGSDARLIDRLTRWLPDRAASIILPQLARTFLPKEALALPSGPKSAAPATPEMNKL